MPKLGFIGYGSMARMLIEGFLAAKACRPEDIVVSTRTREKLAALPANGFNFRGRRQFLKLRA